MCVVLNMKKEILLDLHGESGSKYSIIIYIVYYILTLIQDFVLITLKCVGKLIIFNPNFPLL